MNLLAQIIGVVAMILLFATYQTNKRHIILIFHICISICWIFHYGLLGAISGLAINIVCLMRNIVFYWRGKYRWSSHTVLPVLVCAIEVVLTVAVWQGPTDVLALIGAPLQTVALWMKKPRYIRVLMLIASPMWLIYDLYYKSYAGVLTECIVMISIIIAIVKYDVMKKKDNGALN